MTLEEVCQTINQSFAVEGSELSSAVNLEASIRRHTHELGTEIRSRILEEYISFGPLKPLFDDDSVTEIIINDPKSIWKERHGSLEKHEDGFLSQATYENFVHRICAEMGVHFNLENPTTSGVLNGVRVQIVAPPVAKTVQICFRKHPQKAWTLKQLRQNHFLTKEESGFLSQAMIDRKNILVCGETGAGKTSLINALLKETRPNERSLILEDVPEISLPNSASNRLLTRLDPNEILPAVPLSDLVRISLRLRPDRLILGEIRGPEAKDLILALSSGHRGSLCSIHAAYADEAIRRLEVLIQLGAPEWSLSTIRSLIHSSIDLVVVIRKINGARQLTSIYSLTSVEEFGLPLEKRL